MAMAESLLPLETTAELMAYLAHFGGAHLDEILQRRNVEASIWDHSSEHWKQRMLQASSDPNASELSTFNSSFAATKKRIDDEDLALEDLGPLAEEEPAPTEAAPTVDAPAMVEPPPIEAPPPVHAMPAVESPPLAAAEPEASPWVKPTQAAARVPERPVPPPPVIDSPSGVDSTAPGVRVQGEALPFGDDAAAAPAAAAPEVAAEGEAMAGATSFLAPLSDEDLQRSTPFPKRQDEPPAVEELGRVDGTAFMVAPLVDDPIPFEGENEPPPPAVTGELEQSGETGFMSPVVGGGRARHMSPEHYARLVHSTHEKSAVERQRRHANYGLNTEAQRRELDQAMTAYLQENPALLRLYMQWLGYLRRGGK
jgi:hypothetical protein